MSAEKLKGKISHKH